MNLLAIGKKILDRLPDKHYQKLNNLCDLIKFNYACRIKDECDFRSKIAEIIGNLYTEEQIKAMRPLIKADEIIKLCKEYYKK